MIPFATTLRSIDTIGDEILTADQAKLYARIYNDYEDSLVSALITTARVQVEEYLARAIVEQEFLWTVRFLEHPTHPYNLGAAGMTMMFGGAWGLEAHHYSRLELPRSPVVSVASVTVLDHHGSTITLPADTTWWVDTALDPSVLKIDWQAVIVQLGSGAPIWPLNHIQVTFTAGYTGAEQVPTPVVQAVYLLINYLYERRGDEMDMPEMPPIVYRLLDNFRVYYAGGTLN